MRLGVKAEAPEKQERDFILGDPEFDATQHPCAFVASEIAQ